MKKKSQSFPSWGIALIAAIIVGGYYLYRTSLQSGQVAQISEDNTTQSVASQVLLADELKTTTAISSSNSEAWVPSGVKTEIKDELLKVSIPKNVLFCLTRVAPPNLKYDNSHSYIFAFKGGLSDGKGISSCDKPIVKVGDRKWTAYLRNSKNQDLAKQSVDVGVWNNTNNPAELTKIEFAPRPAPNSSTTEVISKLVICLEKNSSAIASVSLSEIEVSTKLYR